MPSVGWLCFSTLTFIRRRHIYFLLSRDSYRQKTSTINQGVVMNERNSNLHRKTEKEASRETETNPASEYTVYFIAHVGEEIGGRPVPGAPIKMLGCDPTIIGQQVAKLIKYRYREIQRHSMESMPRTKIITLELKSSYLIIRLELPPQHIYCKKRVKAFSLFTEGFKTELNTTPIEDPLIRRRRKSELAAY
jgi:hypothetical protein